MTPYIRIYVPLLAVSLILAAVEKPDSAGTQAAGGCLGSLIQDSEKSRLITVKSVFKACPDIEVITVLAERGPYPIGKSFTLPEFEALYPSDNELDSMARGIKNERYMHRIPAEGKLMILYGPYLIHYRGKYTIYWLENLTQSTWGARFLGDRGKMDRLMDIFISSADNPRVDPIELVYAMSAIDAAATIATLSLGAMQNEGFSSENRPKMLFFAIAGLSAIMKNIPGYIRQEISDEAAKTLADYIGSDEKGMGEWIEYMFGGNFMPKASAFKRMEQFKENINSWAIEEYEWHLKQKRLASDSTARFIHDFIQRLKDRQDSMEHEEK
jgi:hypothetical protein